MTALRTLGITSLEDRGKSKKVTYRQFGLFFVSMVFSIYYPGLGFLVYIPFERYFGAWSRRALVCLIIIQVFQTLTAIGTAYFPIISAIGPPTLV
jgi:hypothetical protein